MKVFISGGSGFLGGKLISVGLSKNWKIWALENYTQVDREVEKIKIDDLNASNALPKFDFVFHLGALIDYNNDNTEQLFKTNVLLTQIISGLKFDRIIYASTISVYKPSNDIIFENSSLSPTNVYAISKYWGEYYIRIQKSYAIIRFSSIFGEGMKANTFIPRLINQAINGKIILFGQGKRNQNYIHVEEAVEYLIKAAYSNKNIIGLAVGEESQSNISIAEKIKNWSGSDLEIVPFNEGQSYYFNNRYTKEVLGFDTKRTFFNDLHNLYVWMKNL